MLELFKRALALYSPRHWPIFEEALKGLVNEPDVHELAELIVNLCKQCSINPTDFPNPFEDEDDRSRWYGAYEEALLEKPEANPEQDKPPEPELPDFSKFRNKEAIENWALQTLGINLNTGDTRDAMIEAAKSAFAEKFGK